MTKLLMFAVSAYLIPWHLCFCKYAIYYLLMLKINMNSLSQFFFNLLELHKHKIALIWIFQLVDMLPSTVNSQSQQLASALASDYVTSAVSALENSKWMTDNMVPRDHLLQMMEYLLSIFMFPANKRSSVFSFPFHLLLIKIYFLSC